MLSILKQCVLPYLLSALILASSALAADTNCPEHFANGIAPDLLNPKVAEKSREICYAGYAILHSGITRTPIYSAEHLTQERILKAKTVKRTNRFHADANLPEVERAELRHYAGSGYDRGHMAPAADMPNDQAMYESFSLANMVPQHPQNNRGVWARIESEIRSLALESGDLYVISGPLFDDNPASIGGAVNVPARLFKAVFDRQGRFLKGYLVANAPDATPQPVANKELQQITSLRFPVLTFSEKQ